METTSSPICLRDSVFRMKQFEEAKVSIFFGMVHGYFLDSRACGVEEHLVRSLCGFTANVELWDCAATLTDLNTMSWAHGQLPYIPYP